MDEAREYAVSGARETRDRNTSGEEMSENKDRLLHDHNHDGVDRRGFLKCMAWAGTGVFKGGVLKSYSLSQLPEIGASPDDAESGRQRDVSHRGFDGLSAAAAGQSRFPGTDEGACRAVEERSRNNRCELRPRATCIGGGRFDARLSGKQPDSGNQVDQR